jgi:hypothetical protein
MSRTLSTTQFITGIACLAIVFGAAHESKMRFGFAVPLVLLCAIFAYQRFVRPARTGSPEKDA